MKRDTQLTPLNGDGVEENNKQKWNSREALPWAY